MERGADLKTFDLKENFRLFFEEAKKIDQIVKYCLASDLKPKYESRSHFYRCAVVKLIDQEWPEINARGRPRK